VPRQPQPAAVAGLLPVSETIAPVAGQSFTGTAGHLHRHRLRQLHLQRLRDWGNGVLHSATISSGNITLAHTFSTYGTYNPVIILKSSDGRVSEVTDTANVAPAADVQISGDPSVNEGDTYTLYLSAQEFSSYTISGWTIDWGDGSSNTVSYDRCRVHHAYVSPAVMPPRPSPLMPRIQWAPMMPMHR